MSKAHILKADCLSLEAFDFIPEGVDVIFSSPPYNIGANHGFALETKKHIKYINDNDNRNDWAFWLTSIVKRYLAKCEYFFLNIQKYAGNKKQVNELLYNLNNYYCDEIIIDKNNGIPNGLNERVMTNCVEYIFIFSNNPSRAVGTKKWRGSVKNIFRTDINRSNKYAKIHRALFQVSWVEYIIDNFVKEGGTIADVFGGLFTTSIGAHNRNIDSYVVEIDNTYYAEGKKRLEELNIEFEENKGSETNEII